MARKRGKKSRSRKKRYSSSESDSSDSDSSLDMSSDSSGSDSDSDVSGLSSSSDSSSDSSDSDSDSSSSLFDDSRFPGENKRKTEEEVRELIRDAKVMKYENAIIDQAGIDNYESIRNCDERTLKRIGMGYSDRERLLKAFRNHMEGIIAKNREKWERKKELKHGVKKKKGKKSKSSKPSKSSKRSKSKSSRKKPSKKSSRSKSKIDPDEALRKLDTGWSGKKQAWADYKQHEARVAELVEFYDEIGKKRANAEEHARRLLVSYPGGIHKLVIALDKKYHHIPYGWESLLEEAQRLQEYSNSSD